MSNHNTAKDAIKAYLDKRADTDEQFAIMYAKPNKNIDECFNYILSEASKRGNSVCMTDDEVFGLAVHYYDEDDIKVSKPLRALSSHSVPVKLTEEEKAKAREEAIERYTQELMKNKELRAEVKREQKAKRSQVPFSPSLFE